MACSICGFDGVEDGRSCAVCGASTATWSVHVAPTIDQPPQSDWRRTTGVEPLGSTFQGRYTVRSLLGRGGMGAVYSVVDEQDGSIKALKILEPLATDPTALQRFRREVQILSRIDHPAVPRIFDWGLDGTRMFLTCELVEGHDLRHALSERGALDLSQAVHIGATVASALNAAHELAVVHRDVKPHNIMLCPDGSLRLLDFGIARGSGIEMQAVTATGMMVGTPAYMSPEQFEGMRVDGRSDIYSLGIVLHELVTGELPFQADTPVSFAIKHRSESPPPLRTVRPDIPAWYERIVLRCLAKNPKERFFTAGELATELTRERKGERRTQTLASGDQIIEDDSETERWALVIATDAYRENWTLGMSLHFQERYYRLDDFARIDAKRWIYRFSFWPEQQILRKVIDYDSDVSSRRPANLASRVGKWLRR